MYFTTTNKNLTREDTVDEDEYNYVVCQICKLGEDDANFVLCSHMEEENQHCNVGAHVSITFTQTNNN